MNLSSLINRGLLTVYGPLVLFVVICGLIANWVAKNIMMIEESNNIVGLTGICAVLVGWIWWSFQVVKWKNWAFSQIEVQDGHKLYERAISAGLIWPVGSVFNKTEIWTRRDKQKWAKLKPEIRQIFEV